LKRKGIKDLSVEEAKEEIRRGISILKEVEIQAKSEIKKKGKTIHQFTEAELNLYAATIRDMLKIKFPDVSQKAFEYAIGMIILMPYYR
jgi:hypothetical protein